MLNIQSVSKGFGTPGTHGYNRVLESVSLTVNKGESIAITGPSGCGKSTLLNIIGSLDVADSGSVMFNGENIETYSRQQTEHYRNKEIGFVFQLHHLFPQCTLYENVLLPTLPRTDKKQLQKRAEMLIRQTGLWERRNDKPSTLSGGECQRTAVARALINGPSLLLADEPTGALDEENATALISLLTEMNKSMETTLIVVTHSKEIARRMDKVYRLTKGVLQAET